MARKYLEDHRLSDGCVARIWKLGRRYVFLRTHVEDYPADDFIGSKAEAYAKMEECLKKDVCDSD